ncbi:copper-translocating P-type ATPase [Arenicella chitinivorans]|uniref:Copper-exporting P-type ATPase n=1 Tax=Arenicella chitinivorans TaxID=1329800 RepID=A0A918VIC5_9GAMM|nr:heavy metal translocating P-type ATPase [Arenicella chitinivorans]GHA03800.1 copper-translocating P-type ATPase [Arenicella chitinivorans]
MKSHKQNTNSSQTQLRIDGASCASCVAKIENALSAVAGVDGAQMNLADRVATVNGSSETEQLISAVEALGYTAHSLENTSTQQLMADNEAADSAHYRQLVINTIVALGLGIPLMIYGMFIGEMTVTTTGERIGWGLVGLATLIVMASAGRHFYIGGWKSIWTHAANMDTLIALGTGAAWLYSMLVVFAPHWLPELARHVYFEATTMIIGLINLGLALEIKARGRTSESIKRLIGLQSRSARVIRNGQEIDLPIEHIVTDDLIRVLPGDKIPVDGEVIEGQTNIDESMLTGEPMPVSKQAQDTVSAGTLNTTGSIVFRATRVGHETKLAHIIEMVKHAQNAKPPIGRLADKIAAYFVPTIMIIAVFTALVWLNVGPSPRIAFAMVCAMTVLIIACPCALGLATPMSVMVGVGKAAEAGVLIRNGEALQSASRITTMVLDKTGTITEGKPAVSDIVPTPDTDQDTLLMLAASLEAGSEHPLASALMSAAHEARLELKPVTEFAAVVGHGITGKVADHQVVFGNQKLMQKHQVVVDSLLPDAQALAEAGKTPMFLAADGTLKGIIAVADPVKADSVAAINRLKHQGIRVIMLTGDNRATAAAVALQVGVDEFMAEVLPEDKLAKIRALQAEANIVGMTGDGINDAPALAQANVGFAIGTGTDVAIESADITLMRGSLHGLADAIDVSKATLRNIKQNLLGAFIYNTAGVPVAAGILYPFTGVLLNPIIAGGAMALSSVTVVLNANRLRWFRAQAQ